MRISNARSVEDWVGMADKIDASNEGDDMAMARYILGDLVHYRMRGKHFEQDQTNLANAIVAYARLLQMHGIVA